MFEASTKCRFLSHQRQQRSPIFQAGVAIGIGDPFLRIIVTSDRSAAVLFCQHGELCHRRIGITVAPANSIGNEPITITMSNADR